MLIKDSFLHIQTPKGRSLGFSAIFSPPAITEMRNERGDTLCWFAVTFCNTKDKHFCKKLARAALMEKAQTLVRARDVPLLLAKAEYKARGWRIFEDGEEKHLADKYNFVLRRFV